MNRSTFQRGPTRDLERSILVLEALLSVSLGNVQPDRLCSTQPLIASMSIDARQRFRGSIRIRDIVDRKSTNVESFMVEDWFGHQGPFRVRVPLH
jgi:hypothetical protein